MPTEKKIRDFLTEKLGLEGWICWWSPRVAYRKQQDIFSIWDGVAARGDEVKFIQFTTKQHKSDHLAKIRKYMALYGLSHHGELWLYDTKTRGFEIVVM